jgi:hypothetical protein
MTTIREIDEALPNGFHDAERRTCTIDYVAQTVAFELDIWTGNLSSDNVQVREHYRRARLVVTGLAFCHIEMPDPAYPFQDAAPLRVDLSDPDPLHPVLRKLPEGAFAGRFYVSNWNAFIHVAGRDADLSWLNDERR